MSAIKLNGTWQQVSSVKVKRGGVWVDHTALHAKLEGAWHQIDLAAVAQGPAFHVWKAYADDANGSGISLSPEGKEYIGFAVGQTVETPDVTDPSVFDWSLIKGTDGQDVDPEVLGDILSKQDNFTDTLAETDSRLKASDDAMAAALSRANESLTLQLSKVESGIATTNVLLSDSVSRIDTAVEGLDTVILATDNRLSSAVSTAQGAIESTIIQLGGVKDEVTGLVSLTGEHGTAIESLDTKTDDQVQRVAILEASAGDARTRITSVETATAEQASRLTSFGAWDGAKFATIKTLEQVDADNAALIKTLETQGANATSRVSTLENASAGHASRLTNVETKATNAVALAGDAADAASAVGAKVTTVTNRVGTLEETSETSASRLTNVETTASTAVSKANAAQNTADSANAKATSVTNRVGTLEETSETNASRLTTVETKATSAQSAANTANAKAVAATNRVTTLEETSETNATRLTGVETKVSTVEDAANAANAKVATVTNRVGTLEETSEEYASRFTSVETKATTGVAKANAAQATADAAFEDVGTITNRVGTLEETSETSASRLTTVETKATTGVTKANAAQATADAANTKATSATNRVSSLEETSEDYASRFTTVETVAHSGVVKADAAQSSANAANSKATTATNRVTALEETSEEYASRFTNVESVASSGVAKANAAQGTANTANNRAVDARNRVTNLEETSSDYAKRFTTVETTAASGVSKANAAQGTANSANAKAVAATNRVTTLEETTATSAERIETVNANQNGAVATAKSIAKAYTDALTGELRAERVIKADANGKVSGIHLLAKGSGANAGGRMYFQADEIAIVPPNWNANTETDSSKFPFYFSNDRKFMYLDEAFIRTLSAETIDSGALAVDGLTLLSKDIKMPAGTIRDYMIDPAFKDGLVRIDPNAVVKGGTVQESVTGLTSTTKVTLDPLKSGGSGHTITISFIGPNVEGAASVNFLATLYVNGNAIEFFGSGDTSERISTEYKSRRTSINYSRELFAGQRTDNNTYNYELRITDVKGSSSYRGRITASMSVSEPTKSSGGFITDVHWAEVRDKPSYVGLGLVDGAGIPAMTIENNPGTNGSWIRVPKIGLLPFEPNASNIGSPSWRFKEIHAVNFHESGTALNAKYLGINSTAKDSDKLAGKSLSYSQQSDTVAVRNGSGDIFARLFRSTYPNDSSIKNGSGIAFRVSTSDNYTRFCNNTSAIRSFLELFSKGESDARFLGIKDKASSAATADNVGGLPKSSIMRLDASNIIQGSTLAVSDGKVAIVANDGLGNSNITFNHLSGRPTINGNAARIEVNTDSLGGASFNFELGQGVTQGEVTSLATILNLSLSAITFRGNTVWHQGNQGSGSGLDADKVDGLHGGQLFRSDVSNNLSNGVYIGLGDGRSSIGGNGPHASFTSIGNITIKADSDGNSEGESLTLTGGHNELVIGAGSANKNKISFNGGVLWHQGNHGAGSGLNADKVDGLHASSFARVDADSNFQKRVLIGGAIIGATSASLQVNGFQRTGSIWLHEGEDAGASAGKLEYVAGGTLKWDGNTVWNSGNDGAGSGLNADMVDGIQAERLIYGVNDTGTTTVSSLDDIWKAGFYQGSNVDDAPTTGWVWAMHMSHSNNNPNNKYGGQFVINNNSGNSDLWFRAKAGNGIGTFRKVWHDHNDGSGSGLDADKLDGLHGSSFAKLGTTNPINNYLYTNRDSTNTAFYAVQAGSGDIASFLKTSLGSTDTAVGVTIKNTGGIVATGGVNLGGALTVAGVEIMNGKDSWLRPTGGTGIYFSSYGGGVHMTDSTYVQIYAAKRLLIRNDNLLYSIFTDGGIRSAKYMYFEAPTGEGGIVGNYKQLGRTVDQLIWSIGTDWATHSTNFGLSHHYGSEIGDGSEHQIVINNNGTAGIRFGMSGSARFNKNVWGADFIATSDLRVKTNIKRIENALDKTKRLTGNTYNRTDLDGKLSAGVIAQEVEAVLPESVTEIEGLKQVAHNGIIGLLVEAIKELSAKVDRLEAM